MEISCEKVQSAIIIDDISPLQSVIIISCSLKRMLQDYLSR
jgi:hypothetical protein